MAITRLSKELKKIRIDAEITRAEMAKTLKIRDKVLEQIELGKIDADDGLIRIIVSTYFDEAIAADAYATLKCAQSDSVAVISFLMSELTQSQRQSIIILKDAFEEQNREAKALAAAEVKKLKEDRAAKRKSLVEVKEVVEDQEVDQADNLTLAQLDDLLDQAA